ncbi:ribosome-associated translation inhibitor RaiA [PVC group bacterium]|nr:ribosome-associated translation inhibitor RaiA [PVC group bacterium]
MHITITGRHLKLTVPLKKYIETKAEKFEQYCKPIIAIHVIMSLEKSYQHVAEMTLQTKDAFITGVSESKDMYASVDLVVEKIKKQLKKHNQKLKDHKRKHKSFRGHMRMNILASEDNTTTTSAIPKLIRSETFAIKPMGIEEALLQLKILGYDFLTFFNSTTEKVNVVYKRTDGNLGLIEPDF